MNLDLLESLALSFMVWSKYLLVVGALTLVPLFTGYWTTFVEWLYMPLIAPALAVKFSGLTNFGDGGLAFFLGFFMDILLLGLAIWTWSFVRRNAK